jgi:hypothetical protein
MGLSGFDQGLPFAVLQLGRYSGDRFRDLPEAIRLRAAEWLRAHRAPDRFAELMLAVGTLDEGETKLVFGDSLPKGLRISSSV